MHPFLTKHNPLSIVISKRLQHKDIPLDIYCKTQSYHARSSRLLTWPVKSYNPFRDWNGHQLDWNIDNSTLSGPIREELPRRAAPHAHCSMSSGVNEDIHWLSNNFDGGLYSMYRFNESVVIFEVLFLYKINCMRCIRLGKYVIKCITDNRIDIWCIRLNLRQYEK